MITQREITPPGRFNGVGPIADPNPFTPPGLNEILGIALGVITIVGGLWFLFTFILGIVDVVRAGDDKNALEGANRKITTGLIGLIVIIGGMAIIALLGNILGINILNPEGFIFNLIY
ncbi:hypothetical protein A3D84_00505 [Candidatus Woesebacteria bacterium RIFCSPHIGHO2_02_FULL_42_20]|uniref:Uncharacterized protein n=1 Tax=Candidatus Woesebacteria bacterium RIFCSPHIGHO2_12_FULL_41_24 TaxID=1802510 RepID=A0A1F8ATT6_9BACT|nr:MAG: hypothetical protein A2W15_02010 [Candidatus Woesebacteria bacterium RBG_16_41_13]OGM29732.1 MAG: hypothetical protein A2873_02430 [Candidatus Woesebacteria bacterium RIFCSPHIGHO2_01_FULL_42_80]OGM35259.1 MAG: hypothetical protein A3D84_00505 [Candidatus Woesebacteria bacterium RIFCSPHIGHO2_02_FULL_42_20]OGM55154.1 MAG: hypothetical protein A3E44_04515 [Candidatus Woesebacteria bacterium RIFCSPHIGHO2_12_FULL_41_24]OGM67726.1 MAG: hypothetical protein A2969_02220 [Candidatus Woesebacteri